MVWTTARKSKWPRGQENLSQTEKLVLSVIYLTSKDIGILYKMSPRNVERHIEYIMHKFGVETRTAALLMGLYKGYFINYAYLEPVSWFMTGESPN